MRHGTASRRQRNRGNGGNSPRRNHQQRMQVFDSNGPDVRIRGTAHQVAEKYMALAKDASSAGDIIMAENYFQHAEHYQRLINEMAPVFEENEAHDFNRGERTYTNNPNNVVRPSAPSPSNARDGSRRQEEDLSLPASILGGEIKKSYEASMQKEMAVAGE